MLPSCFNLLQKTPVLAMVMVVDWLVSMIALEP